MRWFTLIMMILLASLTGCGDTKYVQGRDTVASFGDGRYQILRIPGTIIFYDIQQQTEVLRNVTNWKKNKKTVLLMAGIRGPFVVLHIDSGVTEYYSDLDSSPEKFKPLFEPLIMTSRNTSP